MQASLQALVPLAAALCKLQSTTARTFHFFHNSIAFMGRFQGYPLYGMRRAAKVYKPTTTI